MTMLECSPIALAEILTYIQSVQETVRDWDPDRDNPDLRALAAKLLRSAAQIYGMVVEAEAITSRGELLAARVEAGELEALDGRIAEWCDLLRAELEQRIFLALTHAESNLYEFSAPSEIVAKFPSAAAELEDASRCLAFGMPLASSFHSIRALEVLLNAVASELGIDRGQNWQVAIDQIEKELRCRRSSSNEVDRKWVRQNGQFYAELTQHFFHLKVARRNPWMHWSTDTVDLRRAKDLRDRTIELLAEAAPRLAEDSLLAQE